MRSQRGHAVAEQARKKRSAENSNEVLRDALREAYIEIFNNAGLQEAWAGKGKPTG